MFINFEIVNFSYIYKQIYTCKKKKNIIHKQKAKSKINIIKKPIEKLIPR